MFNGEAENQLDFELPVVECDLEDFDFGTDKNNGTFTDKEFEKWKSPSKLNKQLLNTGAAAKPAYRKGT